MARLEVRVGGGWSWRVSADTRPQPLGPGMRVPTVKSLEILGLVLEVAYAYDDGSLHCCCLLVVDYVDF